MTEKFLYSLMQVLIRQQHEMNAMNGMGLPEWPPRKAWTYAYHGVVPAFSFSERERFIVDQLLEHMIEDAEQILEDRKTYAGVALSFSESEEILAKRMKRGAALREKLFSDPDTHS